MMEKRKFDKLSVEASLLGFGCMRFPTNEKGEINEELATQMLDKAFASGVNYYDTAFPYHDGKSEIFVGKYLDKHDRNSYYLATKLPVWLVNSVDDAKARFEEQLKKLNKDYVDFYLLHALDRNRFKMIKEQGIIEYCEQLKKEGKIKYLGFSFHDGYEAFEEIATYRDWDFCQIQYNYMDIDDQAGDKGYALTEKLDIPLVIMEPVKGGSLANLADDIIEMLPDKTKTPASYALRWVASHPNVKVVLSGMSNMEQVDDNLATFCDFAPLSEEEATAIDNVRDAMNKRVKNSCTGCRYCMPCPAGVDIPRNFRVWNAYGVYNNAGALNWDKNSMKNEGCFADKCVECGLCETKCPQKINIREDLKAFKAMAEAL